MWPDSIDYLRDAVNNHAMSPMWGKSVVFGVLWTSIKDDEISRFALFWWLGCYVTNACVNREWGTNIKDGKSRFLRKWRGTFPSLQYLH